MRPVMPESHSPRPESRVPGRILTAAISATLIVGGASTSPSGAATTATTDTTSVLSAGQTRILAERADAVRGSRNYDRTQAVAEPSAPSDADEQRMLAQARHDAKAEAEAKAAADAAPRTAATAALHAATPRTAAPSAPHTGAPAVPAAAPKPAAGSGDAKTIARALAAQRGWGDNQFACLDLLWTRESGWRVNAGSPSGAYGIPQARPGSKMAGSGSDWQTNPATQITWGLNYIQGHYGSPCGAWAHSQTTGWY